MLTLSDCNHHSYIQQSKEHRENTHCFVLTHVEMLQIGTLVMSRDHTSTCSLFSLTFEFVSHFSTLYIVSMLCLVCLHFEIHIGTRIYKGSDKYCIPQHTKHICHVCQTNFVEQFESHRYVINELSKFCI